MNLQLQQVPITVRDFSEADPFAPIVRQTHVQRLLRPGEDAVVQEDELVRESFQPKAQPADLPERVVLFGVEGAGVRGDASVRLRHAGADLVAIDRQGQAELYGDVVAAVGVAGEGVFLRHHGVAEARGEVRLGGEAGDLPLRPVAGDLPADPLQLRPTPLGRGEEGVDLRSGVERRQFLRGRRQRRPRRQPERRGEVRPGQVPLPTERQHAIVEAVDFKLRPQHVRLPAPRPHPGHGDVEELCEELAVPQRHLNGPVGEPRFEPGGPGGEGGVQFGGRRLRSRRLRLPPDDFAPRAEFRQPGNALGHMHAGLNATGGGLQGLIADRVAGAHQRRVVQRRHLRNAGGGRGRPIPGGLRPRRPGDGEGDGLRQFNGGSVFGQEGTAARERFGRALRSRPVSDGGVQQWIGKLIVPPAVLGRRAFAGEVR
ncbi:hypothetical protein LzC2_00010 [Planctomycetes bacterium LzC2]|uniref:Uncharacterized protein n=1 Tax=Alienimonas chondri TaxID=2681879 RepID=A0ABX1V6K8_9PLAN|nr:hypothetical protein [Alienimonas chondri]